MFKPTFLLSLLISTSALADGVRGSALIIDGDTAHFQRSGQEKVKVRFFGIDTPETKQQCMTTAGACYPCGLEATKHLTSMVSSEAGSAAGSRNDMVCHFVPGKVSYGRKIGVCYHGAANLNVEMVRAGWAVTSTPYLHEVQELKQPLLDAEREARAAKRGIWQGAFVAPYKWRKGSRLHCE